MSDPQQSVIRIFVGRVPVPIFLSAALSASIFFDQFMAVAGVLVAAALILLIVRSANQRDEPLREIGEIVFRSEEQDSVRTEAICQRHRDANETTIRTWRQYAYAVWIFLTALFVKLIVLASVAFIE
ncbi:MAG TPA: hypothetical protein VGM05_24165 [Planctomycetaceae bacterium]|jgi:hypothetical protein